jgi:hypothetical protein
MARIQTSRSSSVIRIADIAPGVSARRWRSVKTEVKPMCASGYPPFIDPKSHPFYTRPRDPGAPLLAPQPVKPEKPKVKTSRPGWLGGWT